MRWHVVCALVAVVQLPSRGRAAFETCDDAWSYGHNASRLLVSQAFARLACDPVKLASVHAALQRAMELQVLRTLDSDLEKLCFYDGLWAGVAAQLATEYQRCDESAEFACVPRELLASYAARTLRAATRALAEPEQVSLAELDVLFSHDPAQEARCVSNGPAPCDAALRAGMDALSLAYYGEMIEPLAASICGERPSDP